VSVQHILRRPPTPLGGKPPKVETRADAHQPYLTITITFTRGHMGLLRNRLARISPIEWRFCSPLTMPRRGPTSVSPRRPTTSGRKTRPPIELLAVLCKNGRQPGLTAELWPSVKRVPDMTTLDLYVQWYDLVSTENLMLKKLTKTGNSLALVLDKPLLDRAQIDADTPLEVSTDGDVIVITPVRDRRRTARLKRIVAEAHRQYGGVFTRLADS
jgi:antitoxin MazE